MREALAQQLDALGALRLGAQRMEAGVEQQAQVHPVAHEAARHDVPQQRHEPQQRLLGHALRHLRDARLVAAEALQEAQGGVARLERQRLSHALEQRLKELQAQAAHELHEEVINLLHRLRLGRGHGRVPHGLEVRRVERLLVGQEPQHRRRAVHDLAVSRGCAEHGADHVVLEDPAHEARLGQVVLLALGHVELEHAQLGRRVPPALVGRRAAEPPAMRRLALLVLLRLVLVVVNVFVRAGVFRVGLGYVPPLGAAAHGAAEQREQDAVLGGARIGRVRARAVGAQREDAVDVLGAGAVGLDAARHRATVLRVLHERDDLLPSEEPQW
mmetsp:Transcript_44918/g.140704  ORF Transcript_44918/g.140704 Transcript_44918/m.140704 type:complete len:329 (-) Transcript_44918:1123-2109(-)